MDLRRGVRYPVELECRVSALRDPAVSESGKTLNMSSCGVLVAFDPARPAQVRLRVGKPARVVVELPNAPYFRGCWLECTCRVVRVGELEGAQLVAFDVKRYRFRPFSRDAPAEPSTDIT